MTGSKNRMRLQLLGAPRCVDSNANPVAIEGRKSIALLAWLVMHHGAPQTRKRLAGMLWPDLPDTRARSNLRVALARLNRSLSALDPPCIVADRSSLRHDPAAPLAIDVLALESTLDIIRNGDATGISIAGALERTDAFSEADFLEGLRLEGCEDFERWRHDTRVRLRRTAIELLALLSEHYLDAGERIAAERLIRRELALDPLNEAAHRRLMRWFAATGDRGAALAHHQRLRALLHEELGVTPETATEQLLARIAAGDPSLIDDAPTSQPAAREMPHNLPPETTAFIGHQLLREQLSSHLKSHRLITLTGIGGIGKSRLALELARTARERFTDGAFLVRLGALHQAGDIPTAVADAIDFQFAPGGDTRAQLLRHLGPRRMLLVLDNFEGLLEGGGLVHALITHAPRLRLIVTSRQRLGLENEAVMPVPGLATGPDPPLLENSEHASRHLPSAAARLFLDVAQRVRLDLAPSADDHAHIERIGRLVDGHPLALVLAAGWLSSLSCAEIADELAGGIELLQTDAPGIPPRRSSVTAAFEQSWELLDGQAQAALAALSVCRGGFDRSAAEAIAGATHRTLNRLVVASLIDHDAARGRYELHELLRQFAAERLQRDGATRAIAYRHARHFVMRLLAPDRDGLQGPDRQRALQRIESDVDNVRAAWCHLLAERDLEQLAALVTPLRTFCALANRERDLAALLEPLLPFVRDSTSLPHAANDAHGDGDNAARAFELDLLLGLGVAYRSTKGYWNPALDTLFERAQTLIDGVDDSPEVFAVLYGVWSYNLVVAQFDRARAVVSTWHARLAAAAARGDASDYLDDARAILPCLEGPVHHLLGQVALAGAAFDKALALDRPHRRAAIVSVYGLNFAVSARYWRAHHLCLVGKLDSALQCAEDTRRIAGTTGQPLALAFALMALTLVSAMRRDRLATLAHAEALRKLTSEHRIAAFAQGQRAVLEGLALAVQDPQEGLARMHRAIDELEDIRIYDDMHGCMIAEVLIEQGRADEALDRLSPGLALADSQGLAKWLSESTRVKGEAQAALGHHDQAALCFEGAFAIAHEQGSLLFELRAAASQLRWLAATAAPTGKAAKRLATTMARFSEGFELPELRESRELLAASARSAS